MCLASWPEIRRRVQVQDASMCILVSFAHPRGSLSANIRVSTPYWMCIYYITLPHVRYVCIVCTSIQVRAYGGTDHPIWIILRQGGLPRDKMMQTGEASQHLDYLLARVSVRSPGLRKDITYSTVHCLTDSPSQTPSQIRRSRHAQGANHQQGSRQPAGL